MGAARKLDDDDDDDDDLPPPQGVVERVAERWETPELAAEVRDILKSIDAPPADADVMFEFQKTLHRGRMFNVDGRGRIVLACRCILESEGNEGAFTQPFVSAVLSSACSEEFAGCGLELVAAFDEINLVGIWNQMKALEYFRLSEANGALDSIVRNKLRRILRPPQPEQVKPPSTKERIAAEKIAMASSRAKVVEQNMELGRKLAALRDETPNNREFGAIVRKQFSLHDSLFVAEIMRVARRYGDRAEIRCKTTWPVLVALSSTLLPNPARQKFEAKIMAGENLTAKSIAATNQSTSARSVSSSH